MPRSVVPSTAALAVCRFEEVSLPRDLLAQLEPRVQGLLSGRERGREVFAGALESGSPDQERRQVLVQAFQGASCSGKWLKPRATWPSASSSSISPARSRV